MKEVDFGPDLGAVTFPDEMSWEQVREYIEKNPTLKDRLIETRKKEIAAETDTEVAMEYATGKMPLSERVGSTVASLPRAAIEGTGRMVQFGGRMRPLAESIGRYLVNTKADEHLDDVPRSAQGVLLDELAAEKAKPAAQRQAELEADPMYKLGTDVVDFGEEQFPTLPGVEESIPSQVNAGLGSIAQLMPAALTGPVAAPFAVAAMYGASSGESTALEARDVINHRIANALADGDLETAALLEQERFNIENTAGMVAFPIGGATMGGLGVAAKMRLGKNQSIGGIGEKLADRMIPEAAPEFVKKRIRGFVEGAATEFAQEASEAVLQNAAASLIYDPDRDIFDSVIESGVIGAAAGGIFGGAVGSSPRKPLARDWLDADEDTGRSTETEEETDVTPETTQDITQEDARREMDEAVAEADRLRLEEQARIDREREADVDSEATVETGNEDSAPTELSTESRTDEDRRQELTRLKDATSRRLGSVKAKLAVVQDSLDRAKKLNLALEDPNLSPEAKEGMAEEIVELTEDVERLQDEITQTNGEIERLQEASEQVQSELGEPAAPAVEPAPQETPPAVEQEAPVAPETVVEPPPVAPETSAQPPAPGTKPPVETPVAETEPAAHSGAATTISETVYRADLPQVGHRHLSGVQDIGQLMGMTDLPPNAPFEFFTTDPQDAAGYADRDERNLAEYERLSPGGGLKMFQTLHGHEPRTAAEAVTRTERVDSSRALDITWMGEETDQLKLVEMVNRVLGHPELPKGWGWKDVPADVEDAMSRYGFYSTGGTPLDQDTFPVWMIMRNATTMTQTALVKQGLRDLKADQISGSLLAQFLMDHGFDTLVHLHGAPSGPVKHVVKVRPDWIQQRYEAVPAGGVAGEYKYVAQAVTPPAQGDERINPYKNRQRVLLILTARGVPYVKPHAVRIAQVLDHDTIRISWKPPGYSRPISEDISIDRVMELPSTTALRRRGEMLAHLSKEERKRVKEDATEFNRLLLKTEPFTTIEDWYEAEAPISEKDKAIAWSRHRKKARAIAADMFGDPDADMDNPIEQAKLLKPVQDFIKKHGEQYTGTINDARDRVAKIKKEEEETVSVEDLTDQALVWKDGEWYKVNQQDSGVVRLVDGEVLEFDRFDPVDIAGIVEPGTRDYDVAIQEYTKQRTEEERGEIQPTARQETETETETITDDPFALDAETDADRLLREAMEAEAERKKREREKIEDGQSAPLTGSQGDIGQGLLIDGDPDADLFTPPAPGTKPPVEAEQKMTPEEKAALMMTRLKGVEHRGNGIHFVPESVMTPDRRRSLIPENQRGSITARPVGGNLVEVKHWADVTGEPSDRGWAIIDRRAVKGFRDNLPVPVDAVDAYGIKVPDDYEKQGDFYVPKSKTAAEPDRKQAEEERELQVVQEAIRIARDESLTILQRYDALVALYQGMDRLGTRTAESKTNQAYSTPPPLAFLANILADVAGGRRFFEITAGNGMLALLADSSKQAVFLNEMDANRSERLKRAHPNAEVTGLDALSQKFFAILQRVQPDRFVMNPPFGSRLVDGRSQEFTIEGALVPGRTTKSQDLAMALNSLHYMDPDGKAVLILGSKTGSQGATFGSAENRTRSYERPEYLELYKRFNVTRAFTVDGKLYSKMGASWPVDVFVIDGKTPTPPMTPLPWMQPLKVYTDWKQLGEILNETSPNTGVGSGQPLGQPDTTGQGTTPATQPEPGRGGAGVRGGRGRSGKPGSSGGRADVQPGAEPSQSPGDKPVDSEQAEGQAEPGPMEGGSKPPVGDGIAKGSILNTLSQEKQAEAADLIKQLRSKIRDIRGSTSMGIFFVDPELILVGAKLAKLYAEAGIRTFAQFAKQVKEQTPDLWNDLKGTLLPMWQGAATEIDGLEDLTRKQAQDVIAELDRPQQPEVEKADPVPVDAVDALTVPYKQASRNADPALLTPSNMADAQFRALQALEAEVGMPVDEYVAQKLGKTVEQLYRNLNAAQIDAVALSIANIERGMSIVNSDQTGVGKGRTVAAVIDYVLSIGKIPIFVTKKKSLYSDMLSRDLPNVGARKVTPVVTDAVYEMLNADGSKRTHKQSSKDRKRVMDSVVKNGKLPDGFNALFTTYHQLQSDKPDGFKEHPRTKARRQFEKRNKPYGPIWDAINALKGNAVLIMDEAHAAAGEESDTFLSFRSILPDAFGAYFASATFAKRPTNLVLYALKNDMRLTGLTMDQIQEVLASGGLPLQQAVTSMMAESGQLVRREQNWEGVNIRFKKAAQNAEREIEFSDQYADMLWRLREFNKLIRDLVASLANKANMVRPKHAQLNFSSTTFAARLFSLSSQYLFSLRADAIADEAIDALNRGQKPFIAIQNTMEGPIGDLVNLGQQINYNGILSKLLADQLRYKIENPLLGEVNEESIDPKDLPPVAKKVYHEMVELIDEMDFDGMPISPIDHIVGRIQEAGYTIGEVTGRSTSLSVDSEGNPTVVNRKREQAGSLFEDYNQGRLDALIVNQSGAEGLSAHSDPKYKATSNMVRHLIVGQPAPDINVFMQIMGRVMRFGQQVLPEYTVIQSSLATEQRFMVMLAKKMASLNANTSADTEGLLTKQEGAVEDIFNEIGDRVVAQVMWSNMELAWSLGLEIPSYDRPVGANKDNQTVQEESENGDFARKATGYFVLLPNSKAEELWSDINELYQVTIESLDATGENPLRASVEDIKAVTARKIAISEPTQTAARSSPFAEPVFLEELEVDVTLKIPDFDEAMRQAESFNDTAYEAWVELNETEQATAESDTSPVNVTRTNVKIAQLDKARTAVQEARSMIGKPFMDKNGFINIAVDLTLKSSKAAHLQRASDQTVTVLRNMQRSKAKVSVVALNRLVSEGATIEGDTKQEWNSTKQSSGKAYVYTGNILTGYKTASDSSWGRPRIRMFTTKDGQRRVGIFMPPKWTPGTTVTIPLTGATQITHAALDGNQVTARFDEGAIRIMPNQDGFEIRMPAKNTFRRIWSDPRVRSALPQMIQRGSTFQATVRSGRLASVVEAMLAADPEISNKFTRTEERNPFDVKPDSRDRVEQLLDRAIDATARKPGMYSDPFLIQSLGMPIVHQALKIAKAVYTKTKDMYRARKAGMAHIEANAKQNVNLEMVEDHFQRLLNGDLLTGESPDIPDRPDPARGHPRKKSRGAFSGNIVPESRESWINQAEGWLEQFDEDIKRAFDAAVSPATGLDPALQQWVLSSLLARSQIALTASMNDVDSMFYLNLQAQIANALKDTGASQFGQVGSARRLALQEMSWMMPVLSFRNLIRHKQKELPFPKLESAQIRKWLKEAGATAIKNLRQAIKDADTVFAKHLKRATRDMGTIWRDVMERSVAEQGDVRRAILRNLIKHPELKDLSPVGYTELTNLLATAWEKERMKVARREFKKVVPLPEVSKRTKEQLSKALPDIIRWANIGLLDDPMLADEAFRNAVAPHFGISRFDGPTAKAITRMAQDAQAVGGVNRTRILQDMYKLIQRDGGVNKMNIVQDFWYAAVLSGTATQVDNGLNILNAGLVSMQMGMVNPGSSPYVFRKFFKGLATGAVEAGGILTRGETFRSINYIDRHPPSSMEAMSESRNLIAKLIGNLKFVGRLMDALDHISAMATDQAAKAWILYRSGNKANLDRFMNPTAEQISNAKERVIMEGTPQRFRAQRLREILDEWVPEEIGMKARELHRMVTFKETPQGIAGVIHEGIVMVDKKFPAFRFLSGTQFTRFAMNYVNMGTNYAAPIALFRWYMSDPARAEGKHGLEYSQERRELLLAQAAIGTLLGTITAALFLSDDDEAEERFIDITGSFKSLTSKKRGQLLSEGRKPYSIRVGDTYISYRQLGFGGLLGAIGELRDRQLFEADKWNAETLPWKVADAAFAGAFIVRDSSSLSGLSEFLGFANSYRYDVDSAIKKDVPRYLAKLSGSFIPNIMKEVDAWADPSIFPARAGHEYFLQQVPFMRRDVGEGPALNVLGEPVRVERYPYSRWIKTRNAGDVAWETLGVLASRGVFMPTVGATSTVKEDGTRRRMTDAEVYRYQERTGQEYRKWIETNHRKLKAMTPIDAADFIDTHADKIRSRVRSEIQRSVK